MRKRKTEDDQEVQQLSGAEAEIGFYKIYQVQNNLNKKKVNEEDLCCQQNRQLKKKVSTYQQC